MPVKPKRNYIEDKTCRAWLEWLSYQYPAVREHVIKIDNEGNANRAIAVSLGLHPGASDYFISWPTLEFYGLWLEVKPEGWKPNSKAKLEHMARQLAFGEKMLKRGYKFAFCVGIDECIEATKQYLEG